MHFPKDITCKCPSACQNGQPTGSFKKLTLPLFQSTANNTSSKIHYLIPPSNKSPYNLRQKQEYQQPSTETKRVADSFIYKCIIKQFNEFLYFFILFYTWDKLIVKFFVFYMIFPTIWC